MKEYGVWAVAVVLALGFIFAGGDDAPSLGVSAGPEVYDVTAYRSGLVSGGAVVATSTGAAGTLIAGDLVTNSGYTSVLRITPTAGNATITLPASSSLPHFAPNAGDRVQVIVENAATAATTTTIAAGTGMDLQEPDGQNVVIGQNNYAVLDFIRESSGNFVVIVDETIPAD
jgi:hypothetical protein